MAGPLLFVASALFGGYLRLPDATYFFLLCSSHLVRSWVLLRNAHLCPEWLAGLEKKLRGLKLNPSFRLFLTSEVCTPCSKRDAQDTF